MARTFKSMVVGAAALAAAALVQPAWAGCGPEVKLSSWQDGAGAFMPAAFTPRSIVGMWSVTFYDENKNVIDFGYSQWHSDGTEILNSGGRAPATENFCLGVWAQVGNAQYKLNHFALSYDASSGQLNAKINIKETVTVDASNTSYTGPFSITVYDPKTNKKLNQVTGTIVGQRITAK